MFQMFDSRYLYMGVNAWYQMMQAPSAMFRLAADQLDERITPPIAPELYEQNMFVPMLQRGIASRLRLMQRLTQSYQKPSFDIKHVEINGHRVHVVQETVMQSPFCTLLHFRKESHHRHPKLLMIAPMAGHYATLLRDTVRDALPYFDVYVTDWANARDVCISQGSFDMDSYIDILVHCYEQIGPDFHVMAICQSGVPAYASVALLEARNDLKELLPKSLTIMGSPIDVRRSPTSVNGYATQHGEDWFEQMALSIVPDGYPGERRLVYPGFMQLAAFISMNPERHQQSISDALNHYMQGDFASEEKISSFYAEYCSVMDLTAEFYLQTVRVVFQEALLPQGKMISRGRLVDPKEIRHTALLAIEGERDDICGLGQTKAALDLATHLPNSKKSHLMLEGAGHYGLFNGKRFRENVLPALRSFIAQERVTLAA